MVYVLIDICAITPMILSTRFEVIKAKLVMQWVKFGLATISIILKVIGSVVFKPGKWLANHGEFLGFYTKDVNGVVTPDYLSNLAGDGSQMVWCILLFILYHYHRVSQVEAVDKPGE